MKTVFMKALILAAGLGTRLRPYTDNTPKPLFTLAGRPLLDIIISQLIDADCKAIIINTHHLHQKINSYLAGHDYTIPVTTRHEPDILGTGGAIKNVADFWNDSPFMVINSDIFTDIDLKKVYEFHLNHPHPATLVFHNDPAFNTVTVDSKGFVQSFDEPWSPDTAFAPPFLESAPAETENAEKLTFTGIQVLNPEVLEMIPDNVFSSIVDTYKNILSQKKKLCAFISKDSYWKDIGTPERYRQVVFDYLAPKAFKGAFPGRENRKIVRTELSGDGSDRKWYRVTDGNESLVMADHGIRRDDSTCEVDAFVSIGLHLESKGIPVPKIHLYDTFSGHVFMEDVGDISLQALVKNTKNQHHVVSHYKVLIQHLQKLSIDGCNGFNPAWAYQTAGYTEDLIIEKECRYFVDAFLKNYLGMDIRFNDLEAEFISLANKALRFSINGFMHRDMQSRNIMVKNDRFYFIDFQGGRLGPIQYDLASLLIDPYVNLSRTVQDTLLKFCVETLSPGLRVDPNQFLSCYQYCAVTRNLQILGAFGFLSRIKKKTYFEKYIPNAINTLKYHLSVLQREEFPYLTSIARKIGGAG
jgi:NDP-sugar pyrophosphorylase family protein/tRNA A-37 threonylcarbamoyl transferase component Bud32